MSAIPIVLWLSLAAQALSILPLALMGVLGINLGALAFQRARQPCVEEGPSWPRSMEPEEQWPSVVVQIPIFNEGLLVRPCLEAVASLDYPTDKLSIQLLDDSNDGSASDNFRFAREIAAQSGLQIDVLQRTDRAGFKAGALAAGLEHSDAELAAVLAIALPQLQNLLPIRLPVRGGQY